MIETERRERERRESNGGNGNSAQEYAKEHGRDRMNILGLAIIPV